MIVPVKAASTADGEPALTAPGTADPKIWSVFSAEPHRMLFLGGAVQILLTLALWLVELVARHGVLIVDNSTSGRLGAFLPDGVRRVPVFYTRVSVYRLPALVAWYGDRTPCLCAGIRPVVRRHPDIVGVAVTRSPVPGL
jgi:hypothetical protein